MSRWLSIPILAAAVLLQATFVPQVRILGGGPDLVFLFVLAWSVHAPLDTCVVWAFVGGIMQDLLSAAPTGASVPGLVLLVFGMHQLKRQGYDISLVMLAGLALAGTLLQQIMLMIVLALSGFTVYPAENFSYIVVPTMAYNLVAIWPIYWFVRRIQKRYTRDGRVFVTRDA